MTETTKPANRSIPSPPEDGTLRENLRTFAAKLRDLADGGHLTIRARTEAAAAAFDTVDADRETGEWHLQGFALGVDARVADALGEDAKRPGQGRAERADAIQRILEPLAGQDALEDATRSRYAVDNLTPDKIERWLDGKYHGAGAGDAFRQVRRERQPLAPPRDESLKALVRKFDAILTQAVDERGERDGRTLRDAVRFKVSKHATTGRKFCDPETEPGCVALMLYALSGEERILTDAAKRCGVEERDDSSDTRKAIRRVLTGKREGYGYPEEVADEADRTRRGLARVPLGKFEDWLSGAYRPTQPNLGGRAPLSEHGKPKTVSVKFSPEEWARIERDRATTGETASDYIRRAVNGLPEPRPVQRIDTDAAFQLQGAANNLNQMARRLNALDGLDGDARRQLQAAIAETREQAERAAFLVLNGAPFDNEEESAPEPKG